MTELRTSIIYHILLGICLWGFACGKSDSEFPPVIPLRENLTPPFFQYQDDGFNPQVRVRYGGPRKSKGRDGAGALLYTHLADSEGHKQTYVLLGLEKSNHKWNFMRGAVEEGQTFVEAAVKEVYEETGATYILNPEILFNFTSYDVFTHPKIQNQACTFFSRVPYLSAEKILANTLNQKGYAFHEMSEYVWIRLEDLSQALKWRTRVFYALTAEGRVKKIDFYLYSFRILQQAQNKRILEHLN